MKIKLQNYLWITYVVVLIVCFVLNLFSKITSPSNIIISAALFLLVLWADIHAWNRFRDTDKIIADLTHATKEIKEDYEEKGEFLWDEYKTRDNLFTFPALADKYKEFRQENNRLGERSYNSFRCDIENYINRELVDKSLDRNVLNLVSGTMTGLGILGTFIGLTIGLLGFDTSDLAAINDSIGGLMNGIKIAFHTSIYGMIFSLTFGYIYRNKTKEAYNAVDNFLDTFAAYVIPDTDNDNMQRLLAYEQKQAEGILDIADTFGDKVAEKLSDVMEPEFRRMNDTIEKFAQVAAESQIDGVGRIVDKFIETMNQSLGSRLLELDGIMKETCEWQKRNMDEMSAVLTRMNGMVDAVARIDELTSQIIAHLTYYMGKIDEMQDLVNQSIKKLDDHNNAYAEVAEKQQQYIAELVNYEREITAAMVNLKDYASEQSEGFKKALTEMAAETKANIDVITKNATDAAGGITEISARQIGQIEQISAKVAESMEKSITDITEVSTKQIQQIGDVSTAVSEGAEKSIGLISETSKQNLLVVDTASKEAIKDIQAAAAETIALLKNKIEEIKTLTGNVAEGMDKSTADITSAVKELNSVYGARLRETFDEFDKALADISRHFSGTLREIESTTGRVPEVVAAAYDGMEKSFDDMQKEIEEMIQAMQLLRRSMAAYRELLEDE